MWLLRAVWSLVGLTVVLAGLPTALVPVVGWPLPRHWSQPQLRRWPAAPQPGAAVPVDVAACLRWLARAWLVYAVAREALARLTRVRLSRLRRPAPMRAAASGMVGAVALGAAVAVAVVWLRGRCLRRTPAGNTRRDPDPTAAAGVAAVVRRGALVPPSRRGGLAWGAPDAAGSGAGRWPGLPWGRR